MGIIEKPSYDNIITYYEKLQTIGGEDSEIIAKTLLEKIELLEGIPCVTRKNSKGQKLAYREKNSKRQGKPQKPREDRIYTETGKHRRDEEYRAMELFNRYRYESNFESELFGIILDYQMPIGGNPDYLSNDTRMKKVSFKKRNIDLISYDKNNDCIYILELKVPNSTEPLIRSAIEGYTYLKMLNTDDFIINMNEIYPQLNISNNTIFRAAPLIYTGCVAAKQYEEIDKWPYMKQMLERLSIVPFIIEDNYCVP